LRRKDKVKDDKLKDNKLKDDKLKANKLKDNKLNDKAWLGRPLRSPGCRPARSTNALRGGHARP
jgi:myo-inositol catabolism protein IolC